MKTMTDRRRGERRKNQKPIAFPERRVAQRRVTAATIVLGAAAYVDPELLTRAEVANARWHTWGTFVNVLGVAVGLLSITLTTRWGERLASYGILFMAGTVVVYALIRLIAGRYEVKAIRLSQGRSQ